jgi:hypothetical protein
MIDLIAGTDPSTPGAAVVVTVVEVAAVKRVDRALMKRSTFDRMKIKRIPYNSKHH